MAGFIAGSIAGAIDEAERLSTRRRARELEDLQRAGAAETLAERKQQRLFSATDRDDVLAQRDIQRRAGEESIRGATATRERAGRTEARAVEDRRSAAIGDSEGRLRRGETKYADEIRAITATLAASGAPLSADEEARLKSVHEVAGRDRGAKILDAARAAIARAPEQTQNVIRAAKSQLGMFDGSMSPETEAELMAIGESAYTAAGAGRGELAAEADVAETSRLGEQIEALERERGGADPARAAAIDAMLARLRPRVGAGGTGRITIGDESFLIRGTGSNLTLINEETGAVTTPVPPRSPRRRSGASAAEDTAKLQNLGDEAAARAAATSQIRSQLAAAQADLGAATLSVDRADINKQISILNSQLRKAEAAERAARARLTEFEAKTGKKAGAGAAGAAALPTELPPEIGRAGLSLRMGR